MRSCSKCQQLVDAAFIVIAKGNVDTGICTKCWAFMPPNEKANIAPTRRDDPETSKEAAAQINWTGRKLEILRTLDKLGDGTSFECASYMARPVQNISSVFKSLERDGAVMVIGTRFGANSNRRRQVYALTDLGRKAL